MRAVFVIDIDLPEDDPNALTNVVSALGKVELVRENSPLHVAIREDAERVLAVFDKEG